MLVVIQEKYNRKMRCGNRGGSETNMEKRSREEHDSLRARSSIEVILYM